MKNIFWACLLIIGCTCLSGCIYGEMYITPLDSILSHPYTKEEVPNYYERRWLNSLPHRHHYHNKDREWHSTHKIRGGTR